MQIRMSKQAEKDLEKIANQSGMFLNDFVSLILNNLLVNKEHLKFYSDIAKAKMDERDKQAQEFLTKKYAPKK